MDEQMLPMDERWPARGSEPPSSDRRRFKAAVGMSQSYSGGQREVDFEWDLDQRAPLADQDEADDSYGSAEVQTDSAASAAVVKTDRFGFYVRPELLLGREKPTNGEERIPLEVLRKREQKWLHMLNNWPSFMNRHFDKVRQRCRKGIPPAVRGRAWKYLSGAAYHMQGSPGVFDTVDAMPGSEKCVDEIEKDLHRQFPEHELFSKHGPYGQIGQGDLFRLLKAYTVLHPEEGYCQGQAPIAATLLMHMPLKDAFYVFVQICHKYLPGYYSAGLEAVQLDGDILYRLLKEKSRLSYNKLKQYRVDPVLYMVEWFMCIFARTLPWSSVLRVWDMFFCEGVKVLFKVAVVLFRYGFGNRRDVKLYGGDFHSILQRLRNLPPEIMEEHFLVSRIVELKLEEDELEKTHYKQLKRRLKEKDSQFNPATM